MSVGKTATAEAEAISKAATNTSMTKTLYSFPKEARFGDLRAPM